MSNREIDRHGIVAILTTEHNGWWSFCGGNDHFHIYLRSPILNLTLKDIHEEQVAVISAMFIRWFKDKADLVQLRKAGGLKLLN